MRNGGLELLLVFCFCTVLSAEEPLPRLVEGRFGQALNTQAGVFVAETQERLGQRPLTVEFWVQRLQQDAEDVVLSHEARHSGGHWEIRVTASGVLRLSGLGTSDVDSRIRLEPNHWHHVAVVLQKSQARVYVNGQLAADRPIAVSDRPAQPSGLAVGGRIEDRRPSQVLIDDLRISSLPREILAVPDLPLVKDEHTLGLWTFDEAEADYLAKWTPGGETNQRDLPYPHRYAGYEFETDEHWTDNRWQQTVKGPFVSHSIQLPGRQVGPKNLAIYLEPLDQQRDLDTPTRLGDDTVRPMVLFDLQRCGIVASMLAGRLKTEEARFGLLRKPTLEGQLASYVPPAKIWRTANNYLDSKPIDLGSIEYQGLYLHGNQVFLSYRVFDMDVWETCHVEMLNDRPVIVRQFTIDMRMNCPRLTLTISERPRSKGRHGLREPTEHLMSFRSRDDGPSTMLYARWSHDWIHLDTAGDVDVDFQHPINGPVTVEILQWEDTEEDHQAERQWIASRPPLQHVTRPPSASGRWAKPLLVPGHVDPRDDRPYVVDTIDVPFENPYQALFFISSLDFFPNGDAALCTAHGDVWLVRGINEDLQRVTWQRYATGLYQPLGLKVVDEKVLVLGRDQLTLLHDENNDGEADYYESFNNDLVIRGQDHAYAMRLERDPAGYFYFVKSGQAPEGSAVYRLSPDGLHLDRIANGFRHPFGAGMSPDGQLTVADNEGGWVPSSKIDLIREGGFYGFLGGAEQPPDDLRPEQPLCYIPKVADNSCGGQTWVTSSQWGQAFQDQMLHLSWGRCTLHAVLRQQVGDTWQAATVQFPNVAFESGPGQGVFHPVDGQLYVVGLDGWQTGAIADGCFQRVRYTGQPVAMPVALKVTHQGLLVTFSDPLDPEAAADISNYRAEQWNYRWSSTYGSFHYSVQNPDQIGHDKVFIESVQRVGDSSVLLVIPDLKPVDQFHLHTDIRTGDGRPLPLDLYGTINALPTDHR